MSYDDLLKKKVKALQEIINLQAALFGLHNAIIEIDKELANPVFQEKPETPSVS
jgi:hypothetical protein